MSHCQQGEKAHLWINGNEHWIFDGPIDVSITEVAEYKAPQYVATVLRGSYDLNFRTCTGSRLYTNTSPPIDILNATAGAKFTTYLVATPIECGFYNVRSGITALNGRIFWKYPWMSWIALDAPGSIEFVNTSMASSNDVVWNINPVAGSNETREFRLKVERSGLLLLEKAYQSMPEYAVKCADRCPPGQVWDQKCGQCVCEGMGAIKAGLSGALSIARSIKP